MFFKIFGLILINNSKILLIEDYHFPDIFAISIVGRNEIQLHLRYHVKMEENQLQLIANKVEVFTEDY